MSSTTDMTSPPSSHALSRDLTRRIGLACALAAAVFAVLAFFADLPAMTRTLAAVSWTTFAAAVALATANYIMRLARWHYYLRASRVSVPFVDATLVFLAGFVMGVTPGKVGELFKSLLLHESFGTRIVTTAPIVVAERLTDLLALVVLIGVSSLGIPNGVYIAVTTAVLVGGLLAVCVVRPLGELGLAIAARTPFVKRLTPKLRSAYDSLQELTRPWPLLVGTVLGVVAWAFEGIALWVILKDVPGALDLQSAVFCYCASTVIGAVALLPGGLGATEASMTGLLLAVSRGALPKPSATAATMLVRVATLWWAVLLGALALGAFRARAARAARA